MTKYTRASLWAILMVVLDQATKLAIVASMPEYAHKKIISGFFDLVHLYNKGAAWGVLNRDDITWQVPLFVSVTIVALALIGYMLKATDKHDKWAIIGLGCIAGGAFGNLIDRVRIGAVIDFLDFYVGQSHWPAFNIADSALTVGGFCIVVSMLLHKKKEN